MRFKASPHTPLTAATRPAGRIATLLTCALSLMISAWADMAEARVVTTRFEAEVFNADDLHGLLGGTISVGSTIEGWYTYDPDAPGTIAPFGAGAIGQYPHSAPHEFVILAGGFTLNASTIRLTLRNDFGAGVIDDWLVIDQTENATSDIPGVIVSQMSLGLVDSTQTAFSDVALPERSPPLGDFDAAQIDILGCLPSERVGGFCSIASLYIIAAITTLETDAEIEAARLAWNHPIGANPGTIDLNLPGANGGPGRVVLATPVSNPFSVGTHLNNRALAVRFDGPPTSRWQTVNADGSAVSVDAAVNAFVPGDTDRAFVHTTGPGNLSGNHSLISHPMLDGRPDARVFVTQNLSPGGIASTANPSPIGLWYTGTQWSVFNQDLATMAAGESYNVFIAPTAGDVSLVHVASAGNTTVHLTRIDHPKLNGRPEAQVFVTQNWNPGGVGGTYNAAHVGTVFDLSSQRWAIQNLSGANMPVGAAFNVFSPDVESASIQHRADSDNISFNWSYLDHPLMQGSFEHRLLTSPTLSPLSGPPGVLNPRPTGVFADYFFDPFAWATFNQDLADYPLGTVDNVHRPAVDMRSFVHEARLDTILGDSTQVSHPLLDDTPGAVFVVTPSWNPDPIAPGIYNDSNLAVSYAASLGRWFITNNDLDPMPNRASFNVLLPSPRDLAIQHIATAGNTSGAVTALDHPMLNGSRWHLLLIQNNNTALGATSIANDHPITSEYDEGTGRWTILNQDGAAIVPQSAFNVIAVPEPGGLALLISGLVGIGLLSPRKKRGAATNSRRLQLLWTRSAVPEFRSSFVQTYQDMHPADTLAEVQAC